MTVPKHWSVRAESRGVDEDLTQLHFRCERPEKCNRVASSIHHIGQSFRGKRDNSVTNLIALCHKHHEEIHASNGFDNRQVLLDHTKILHETYDANKYSNRESEEEKHWAGFKPIS